MKVRLQNESQNAADETDRVRLDAQAESRRLAQEMSEAAADYAKRIESMEEMYKYKMKQLGDNKNREASVSC